MRDEGSSRLEVVREVLDSFEEEPLLGELELHRQLYEATGDSELRVGYVVPVRLIYARQAIRRLLILTRDAAVAQAAVLEQRATLPEWAR